jgi:uncharacterized protein
MSSTTTAPKSGTIGWHDLTVRNAEGIRDFYREVVGWEFKPEPMSGYEDFCMIPSGGTEAAAGICHARGHNADLPATWLMYIIVKDADAAAERCRQQGGVVIAGPRFMAGGRVCVIQDPAGAVCALFTPPGSIDVGE